MDAGAIFVKHKRDHVTPLSMHLNLNPSPDNGPVKSRTASLSSLLCTPPLLAAMLHPLAFSPSPDAQNGSPKPSYLLLPLQFTCHFLKLSFLDLYLKEPFLLDYLETPGAFLE